MVNKWMVQCVWMFRKKVRRLGRLHGRWDAEDKALKDG